LRAHKVKGHVAANLHVGNDRAKLIDVLAQLLPFISYPRTLNGLRAIDEVTGTFAEPSRRNNTINDKCIFEHCRKLSLSAGLSAPDFLLAYPHNCQILNHPSI
jgi:hypothetical protein